MKTSKLSVMFAFVVWAASAPVQAAPTTAIAPLLQGYLAQGTGDTEGALEAFREAIRLDPESAEARSLATFLLASTRRFPEALELVEEGLRKRPGEKGLLLWKARLLEALNRREEAAEAARAAALGGRVDAYPFALRLLDGLGKTQEAADLAATWSTKFPKSPEPHFALAQLFLRLGDKGKAREAFQKALDLAPGHLPTLRSLADLQDEAGNSEAAEALYRKVIEANPHDLDARFRLGQMLVRQNRTEEMLKLFKDVERWGGERDGTLRFGMLLLQAERPSEAEAAFRMVAEAHPNDAAAWYLLGVSLSAQEKFEAALEAFSRISKDAAEYDDALIRRAQALRGLKRVEEGVALLRGWLAQHPDDEDVILAVADLLEGMDNYRAAADLLEGYAARVETKNNQFFFSLGVLYDKLKDWERSADNMKHSLALKPDDPHALNYLGYTYAERGVHLEEAEKLILRALELKPGDGAITDSLGWVYFKQGRLAEAEAQLRKAAELMPKDAVIWEHLGDTLKAMGNTAGAREAYRKAVELDSGATSAREKLEALP